MMRYVQTIFCDDIRHEVGGKSSFIGVYEQKMLVPKFPVVLPRLCLAVKAVTPAAHPFHNLSMKVLKDDEVIALAEIDAQDLADAEDAIDDNPGDECKNQMQVFLTLFTFSPFQIQESCVLRVRAQTNEEELRGLGLQIATRSS